MSASGSGRGQPRTESTGAVAGAGRSAPVGSWARPERSTAHGGSSRAAQPSSVPQRGAPQPGKGGPGEHGGKSQARRRSKSARDEPLVAEEPSARNNAGTASLLCGLLGLIFMALFPPIGLVLAVIALICGMIGRSRGLRGIASNRGQVLAGLLCGGVSLVVSGAFVVTELVYVANHPGLIHSISNCAAKAHTSKASSECVQKLTKAIQGAG